jgi:hypothetical protein
MDFKTFVESWLHLDDPTGYGLELKARIERIPGKDGKGAYTGTLHINTPMRTGGGVFHTRSQPSIEATQTDLRNLLQRPKEAWIPKSMVDKSKKWGTQIGNELVKIEVGGLPAAQVPSLEPVLIYGGNWNINALQKQQGYSREKHVKDQEWMDKFMGVMDEFKRDMSKEAKTKKKFGDGPPEFSQWITSDDIKILPDMIKTFGDFWLVIKWAQRARQVIRASDLAKHYDRIFKDAEVKTNDYAREIFVRENPQQGI